MIIEINKNTALMISAVVIFVLVGALAWTIVQTKQNPTGAFVSQQKNSLPVSQSSEIFTGKITNMNLAPGTYDGTGVYDKSCLDAGGGLTECDGGIKTDKGTLNFHYKHNMAILPCIAPGDGLVVEVLDADGNAKVTRTSGGGNH